MNSGCTLATLRNSSASVRGHCILHQLMGTIVAPATHTHTHSNKSGNTNIHHVQQCLSANVGAARHFFPDCANRSSANQEHVTPSCSLSWVALPSVQRITCFLRPTFLHGKRGLRWQVRTQDPVRKGPRAHYSRREPKDILQEGAKNIMRLHICRGS